jgi:hypothetical protein
MYSSIGKNQQKPIWEEESIDQGADNDDSNKPMSIKERRMRLSRIKFSNF